MLRFLEKINPQSFFPQRFDIDFLTNFQNKSTAPGLFSFSSFSVGLYLHFSSRPHFDVKREAERAFLSAAQINSPPPLLPPSLSLSLIDRPYRAPDVTSYFIKPWGATHTHTLV